MRKCIILFFSTFSVLYSDAQKPNWQNMDLQVDSVFGISVEKAYAQLLKGKKSQRVIVAIIDSGVDTLHEDLKPVLWTNGDGTHGWDFIGPETGKEDITQLVGYKKDFYDSLQYTNVPETYRAGYQAYRKLSPALNSKINAMKALAEELEANKKVLTEIVKKTGKDQPALTDLKTYQSANADEERVLKILLRRLPLYKNLADYRTVEIDRIIDKAKYHLDHGLNLKNEEPDTATGDTDISPDPLGLVAKPNVTAYHGTHVAGIIGAVRNNGIGMNGIADNVEIMMLKENGTIREMRDKCLAQAIIFAVDHGAKIINLSFGKPYTWDKHAVDEAVKYAMSKDVLLIHAAGNTGQNLDNQDHYPNPVYQDGSGTAAAWLEVGASGYRDDSTLVASFSNYGKSSVDLFAPGVAVYSTLPFNQYQSWDGTSMAAPVVSGVAALIREYYPYLHAAEVKEIIMRTVTKVEHSVTVNRSQDQLISLPFSEVCVSGGVINAYNALKLAANFKK